MVATMEHPELPESIEVLPGTDVEGEWERFEVFEALHHGMRVCNPMSGADVTAIVERVEPRAGESVLDIACGHGELLIQLAERAPIRGTGVDLSPWVLVRAQREAAGRVPIERIRWVLGNAHELPLDRYDIVTCVGASWIWHGFTGTVAAMADRLHPGGRIAIGDLRLKEDRDLDEVVETYGRVLTADEQASTLADHGFTVIERVDPGVASWNAYQERIADSVAQWRLAHPGDQADRYVSEQERWRRDHDRDMAFLDWSVWIARSR